MRKVSVQVIAIHDLEGNVFPREIIWEDGSRYEIDRVLDIRQAASLKVGGRGMRYTCRIRGKETYLYDDRGKWFMEGK